MRGFYYLGVAVGLFVMLMFLGGIGWFGWALGRRIEKMSFMVGWTIAWFLLSSFFSFIQASVSTYYEQLHAFFVFGVVAYNVPFISCMWIAFYRQKRQRAVIESSADELSVDVLVDTVNRWMSLPVLASSSFSHNVWGPMDRAARLEWVSQRCDGMRGLMKQTDIDGDIPFDTILYELDRLRDMNGVSPSEAQAATQVASTASL